MTELEKRKRLRTIYYNIKQRIKNKHNKDFLRYGGSNIKMCPEWEYSFENFYNDLKDTYFKNATLDRIDVFGDYCPDNVKWITRAENTAKMQRDKLLTRKNKTGYRGVSYYKQRNIYRATFKYNGKTVHLGYYNDPKKAAKAYNDFLDKIDHNREFKRNKI